MPNTPHRLYYGRPTTTVTSVYTVPANARTILKQIMVGNNHTENVVLSVFVVPSGGSTPSGTTNRAIVATIAPGQTETLDMSAVMMPGDTLWVSANITNVLQVWISGVVNT